MKKLTLSEIQQEEEKRRQLEQAQIQAILEQQAVDAARAARESAPNQVWGATAKVVAPPSKLSLREIQEQEASIAKSKQAQAPNFAVVASNVPAQV
jgi:hypothetical protein